MSLEREDELIGEPSEDVPKIEPGEDCNGKKIDRTDEGDVLFNGYCNNPAGFSTDHVGEGRCKFHGGYSSGPPEGSRNAATHGLSSDPETYFESQSPERQAEIERTTEAILERLRAKYDHEDKIDHELAHRVAIKLDIAEQASVYIQETGLIQVIETAHSSKETRNTLLAQLRRYDKSIIDDLEKLGVFDHQTESNPWSLE
ncbi:hypothetical protein [Natronococcus roseus]|uniref:hypothetical protein n=1 Tax=Natronococcus roseus TaxID=1052014 RepID=UPI00374CC12F